MKLFKVNFSVLVIILTLFVIGLAFFALNLGKNVGIEPISQEEQLLPPVLKSMVDEAVADSPNAPWVTILSNNELYISYVVEDKSFFVTILDAKKEDDVKRGVKEYLTGLGVEDLSKLNISFRTLPTISGLY